MLVNNTNIVMQNFKLLLTDYFMLNDRMRHLTFEVLIDNPPLKYLPGQFISLMLPKNNSIVRRNFSIANPPSNNTKTIEIAATFVPNGIASTTLWNLKIGEQLEATGPFGIFILNSAEVRKTKRYILVATGTGVTPYRAMLPSIQQILANPLTKHLEFIIILGVRNNKELLYAADFIDFEHNNNNFKFIACYSRNHNNLQDTNYTIKPNDEYLGYVQNKLITLDLNPENDIIYLCGNPKMIDETTELLVKYNIPKFKIKREKYISSK